MALPFRTRLIALVSTMVVALALLGGAVVRANDASSLPPIQADLLLANVADALAQPFTIAGDVQTHLDLGLPELPAGVGGAGLGGDAGVIAMLGGTQRFRVWHSADGIRIAQITQVSERDLVVNRREAWWWDAATMEATKVDFAALGKGMVPVPGGPALGPAGAVAMDPVTAARRGIEALAPFASVAVEGTGEVAGRAVYDLVLTPLSDRTLIGSVELSIDAETWLPLRFQVIARADGEAAMSAGFTSVSYDAIDPAVFEFSAPPGAEVLDGLAGVKDILKGEGPRVAPIGDHGGPTPKVFGEGFESRVAIPLRDGLPAELAPLLPYAGPLFSVMETGSGQDRWLLIGAVPVDVLQGDAATLP
ncbi:MAG TPA: hypothetical protein VI341_04975 [Actinomycetota bacterium]